MSKYRIYIESETSGTIPKTQVFPTFTGEFSYTKESGKLYYKKEISEKLKFTLKSEYDLIIAQENADECEKIIVTIEKKCGTAYSEEWVGYFSVFTSTINRNRCWFEVKPKPNDAYQCFEDVEDEEINVFSATPIVQVTSIAGEYETRTCQDTLTNQTFGDYFAIVSAQTGDNSCLLGETEWFQKSLKLIINGTDYSDNFPYTEPEPFDIQRTTEWHRETIETPCVFGVPDPPSFGTGWLLLNDDCAGSGNSTYYREPTSSGEPLGDYNQGRLFSTILDRVMALMNCGLTIKSDFFNVNALGDSPTNIAYTYAQNFLQRLTFHQKSDIMDKTATNPSSFASWNFTPEDFFNDVAILFNVFPVISGTTLILEHYSFFTSAIGADDTSANPLYQFTRNGEIKKQELFYYSDEKASSVFLASPIKYPCGENKEERRLRLFSCDLGYLEDPSNVDNLSTDNFVLVSTTEFSGQNIIIDNNEPLAWPNLLENLHMHGRLFPKGTLNGVDVNFLSWKPYKDQEPYYITLCCDETFNPDELRTTEEGNGQVKVAKHNIITGKLELQLSY